MAEKSPLRQERRFFMPSTQTKPSHSNGCGSGIFGSLLYDFHFSLELLVYINMDGRASLGMSVSHVDIDFKGLEADGYTIVRGLVRLDEIREFEATIERLVQSQLSSLDIAPRHADQFIDVFKVGGRYTDRLYKLMERLFILQRIGVRLGDLLQSSGFYEWAEIDVPLVWPDIRADIPGDNGRLLPVHQDFKSTQCERAWRLWIPLRPSNAETGTMCLYTGTHKLGVVEHNTDNPHQPFVDEKYYRNAVPEVLDLPAGDAVIMNPLILHASVPNRSHRTKFTLMMQVQDLAAMINPDDTQNRYTMFSKIAAAREASEL
jgi:hypothetical protein